MPTKKPTIADHLRAELQRQHDRFAALKAESDRLERSMARLVETNRSLAILLGSYEQDRDAALQRLSTASYEATDWRRQLVESRALLQRLLAEREHRTASPHDVAAERGDVVPADAHKPG